MLIGCGPHARRIYVPAIFLQKKYSIEIKAIVELIGKEKETRSFVSEYSTDVEYFFVRRFKSSRKLPKSIKEKLNSLVEKIILLELLFRQIH